MREIKFRAWDQERNELLPITLMDWNTWWVSCEPILDTETKPLDYGERNSFQNEATDRHILMQYTGLQDKNGKEIYEGDIVTTTYGKYELEPNGLTRFGTVIYNVATASFVISIKNSAVKVSFYDVNKIEIVGNIYQTPAEVTP